MGIYQRDLTTYEQTPIAENRNFGKQCINCHTFNRNSPDTMMVHVRGKQGGTLISLNGEMEKVDPKPEEYRHGATYPAWHPSGRYIAFSANEIQQFFHSSGQKPIEVSDLAADLMIYDVQTHETFTDSLVYGEQYIETFPTWSPDGNRFISVVLKDIVKECLWTVSGMIYIVYILTQNIPNCIHWNVSIKHQPFVRLSLFREFHRMAGSFYLLSLITAISPSGILKVIYICLIWLQVIYEISRK